jgi:hypothetical protein
MEGIVTRNAGRYPVDAFAENVFKYVHKGHVKTDEHWTRYWKRAQLKNEGGKRGGSLELAGKLASKLEVPALWEAHEVVYHV